MRPAMVLPSAVSERCDARWNDAIRATVGLWLMVMLIYLPVLIRNHNGEGIASILLDVATFPVSMLFAMPLFVVFRATIGMPTTVRALLLVPELLLITVLQITFDLLYTAFVIQHSSITWVALPHDLGHSYSRAFNYITVFSINIAAFQVAYSRRRSRRQERQLATLVAASQQAEIDALVAKLSPHFLFNTLNVISGLVVTRRNEEADDLLTRLSAFLRASLGQDAHRFAAVDSELARAEDYLEIERARFGERLVPQVRCQTDVAGIAMPRLLLQPLIDIAIRDGVDPLMDPASVIIEASTESGQWLRLDVGDDARIAGRTLDPNEPTFATIRQRLSALFGDQAGLIVHADDAGFLATMRLPLDALRREMT